MHLFRLTLFCLIVTLTFGAPVSAWAEKRVALVIGNSNYTFGPLANPRNDAKLMERTLKRVGFEVISAVDADLSQMKQAIVKFGRKLRDSGPDAVGFFFYAGHGVQAGGSNYLIPTTAEINDEAELEIFAVNAGWVLGQMESAGNAVNIIVMDACRNNPFKRSFRSATRGLARMNAPSGSFISYATAPGDVASDGTGKNSPYTSALAKEIVKPGMKVEEVFKSVRISVRNETDKRQTPWEASSLTGDFYFQPGTVSSQTQAGGTTPAPASSDGGTNMEAMFWNAIKDSEDAADYQDYLTQFPNGTFARMAKRRSKALKTDQVAIVTPPAPTQVGQTYKAGKIFKDCPGCPEMVVIPAGSYRMGDLAGDRFHLQKPVHSVTIAKAFAVGIYEVTQAEWRTIMGSNPSLYKEDKNPVQGVFWDEAKEFSRKLSAKTGQEYRLLSEAEWEYAARAGSQSKYSWGNSISHSQANYGNIGDPKRVGSYAANAFGLHDMHGNVSEWVEDCWNALYNGAPTNGTARLSGNCKMRPRRGGSWMHKPIDLRSANRWYEVATTNPILRNIYLGLRVARDLPPHKTPNVQGSIELLRGRNVSIETDGANSIIGKRYCSRLRNAGLKVSCVLDKEWDSRRRYLWIDCPTLPKDTVAIIQAYLGTDPEEFYIHDARVDETWNGPRCGKDEILVWLAK